MDVKRREAGSCEVGGFLDEGVSGWRLGWGWLEEMVGWLEEGVGWLEHGVGMKKSKEERRGGGCDIGGGCGQQQ